MNESPYLTIYLVALILAMGVAGFAWSHRRVMGAVPFALNVVFQATWTVGYIFELLADSQSAKLFWDNVQWIGSFAVPSFGLIFVLQYIGHPLGHSRRLRAGLAVVAAIFMALTATDGWHGLIHQNTRLEAGQPFDILLYDYTPLVWIAAFYLYAIILTIQYLLLRHTGQVQGKLRSQAMIIMAGFGLAMMGGILSLLEISFSGQRDATPLFFALGNAVVAWGLFRHQLFNLVPVARDRVIETIDNPVIVLDRQRRVVDLNPAAQRVVRMPDPIGERVARVFADWPGLVSFIEYDKTAEADVTHEDHTYTVRETALRGRDGSINGWAIVLTDITPRVLAETAVGRHVQAIEAANIELEKARAAAEQLNSMKSQFLARMSHELRTPLNAVLNFTEFVAMGMMGSVNVQQHDALQKSLDSGRHLMSLINDILDMSKIEAGMLLLFAETDVNLHEEVQPVIAATEALLADKPVQLVLDIDEGLPRLVGDRRRLRQILLNLLSNAARFTDEGSITLSIKQRQDNIVIMVSDTGPGIALPDQAVIFEAFRQTERGQASGSGTGLGLPITRSLVEAHGGHIWLESTPNEGTDFFISLPIQSDALLQTIPEEMGHVQRS